MKTAKTIWQIKDYIGKKIRKKIWDLQVIGFSDEEIARIVRMDMCFVKPFLTDDYTTNGLYIYSLTIDILLRIAIKLGVEFKIE